MTSVVGEPGIHKDFDWIDDAFDDKKTATDIENAKASKSVGCLFAVVLVAVVAVMVFGLIGIVGALDA